MLRFASLVLLVAYYDANVVLAAPQAMPNSPSICDGYMWGVTIQRLDVAPVPVYNQYVQTTGCAGPAWVQSTTVPTPPLNITPWGTEYDCQVPEARYYCGETPVATCCGKFPTSG